MSSAAKDRMLSSKCNMVLSAVFGMVAVLGVAGKFVGVFTAIERRTDTYSAWSGFATTWLVDYSQGYVRRGLCGEILRWCCRTGGVDPHVLIVALCLLTTAAATVLAFWAVRRRGLCWWPIMLTVCLGGLVSLNKDGLVLILCMACYWTLGRIRGVWMRYAVLNALAIVLVNVHEIGFFLTFPVAFFFALGDDEIGLPWWMRPAALMPMVVAFGFAAHFKGDVAIAQGITTNWQSCLSPWWDHVSLGGVRTAVGSSAADLAKGMVGEMSQSTHGVPNAVLFVGEFLVAFVVASRMLVFGRNEFARILLFLVSILLAPILIIFPFFHDYSRLFGFWTMSAMMSFALVPPEKYERTLGLLAKTPFGGIVRLLDVVNGKIAKIPYWAVVAMALLAGMSAIHFSFRQCLGRSVVGSVVHAFVVDPMKAHGDFGAWWRLQAR